MTAAVRFGRAVRICNNYTTPIFLNGKLCGEIVNYSLYGFCRVQTASLYGDRPISIPHWMQDLGDWDKTRDLKKAIKAAAAAEGVQ